MMLEKEPFINQIRTLIIETTNACNYHCTFCPREKMTRQQGVMDFGLFKKIIDEAQHYNLREIDLNNFGEPLLDKMLVERIKYIKSKLKNVTVSFNTNASLLNGELATNLINSGLDEIRLSIYASNPENYRQMTKQGDFNDVRENIIKFAELKKKLGKNKPVTCLGFLQSPDVKESFDEWKELWERHVDKILNSAKPHNLFGGRAYCKINKKIKRMTCGRVHQIANIWQNGDVSLCCIDFDGKVVFGNINDKSLKDILESEAYQKMVKMHEGNFLNCPLPLCDNCSILLPATLRNKVARWIFLHIKRRYAGR